MAIVATAAGCRPQDEIARYTVPSVEAENQMLGAIVPVEKAGWFFKLVGPKDQVAPLQESFISFVKGLRFEGTPKEPKWELPDGWKERPGSQFRFATIEVPTKGKPLELSVSMLDNSASAREEFLLANINRWRDQMHLTELSADELAANSVTTKVGDYEGTLVNLVGTGSGGMSGAPFASTAPFASGGMPTTSAPAAGDAPSTAKPTFTKPATWTEGELNQFRKAAFNVSDGDKTLLITLIDLSPSPLLANIERWAREIGVESVAESDLPKLVKKIDVAGVPSDYVELVGPVSAEKPQAVLGVIVPRGNVYWFVKLKGDAELAEREKANFEAFVKSLKFE